MTYIRLLSILSVLSFVILLGFTENAKAQTKVGISGGLNISSHLNSFKFERADIQLNLNPNIVSGYQGGLILRHNITKAFRIQLEPSAILLGARYDEPFTLRGSEFQTNSRTKLLYLQLPLLFQLTTVPPERVVYGREMAKTTYHLSGGFFGGYLLDARFKGTNSGAPVGVAFEGNFSNDVSAQYYEYDGGVIAGIGLEHGTSRKIGIEARAQYSVFDSGNDPTLSFEPHNMAVTFSVYLIL
ncbi:outer membrane beta-barrel protein [Fodinibius salsisoli]|uniref:PorT family protein n=1 Tax=Fodinibius salsisoli TaxID=2820877 RepID=A0ABT3PM32_9BACT|nr:outer membrane beta-barrel protein [Fodinibius salsisoli]MCW9706778.1 PorT family protein [Fodinibius salsisoli]